MGVPPSPSSVRGVLIHTADEAAVGPLRDALRLRGHDVAIARDLAELMGSDSWPELVLCDDELMSAPVLDRLADHPARSMATIAVWRSEASFPGLATSLDVDDVFDKFAPVDDTVLRIELAIRRGRRLLETSPLTGLPGNSAIRRELEERTEAGQPLAVVHSDLDGFKAYNDRYGFARGDDVIRFCADCLRLAAAASADTVFVGHVGGDDFVAMLDATHYEEFCDAALTAWNNGITAFYDAADRARGHIVSLDRRGNPQTIPIATMSLGVATNLLRPFESAWQAAAVASEMKEYAKEQTGSNFQVDRRS